GATADSADRSSRPRTRASVRHRRTGRRRDPRAPAPRLPLSGAIERPGTGGTTSLGPLTCETHHKPERHHKAVSKNVSQFGQNQWLVDEMYHRYTKDPSSVDRTWHEFFDANPGAASSPGGNGAGR